MSREEFGAVKINQEVYSWNEEIGAYFSSIVIKKEYPFLVLDSYTKHMDNVFVNKPNIDNKSVYFVDM